LAPTAERVRARRSILLSPLITASTDARRGRLRNSQGGKPVILLQTHLRVNTDGSPLSYHSQDPLGKDQALNNICNAIAVRRIGENTNLCLTEFKAAIGVFEKFRDSNYQKIPDGFQITWANVMATVKDLRQGRQSLHLALHGRDRSIPPIRRLPGCRPADSAGVVAR
jgi:hypothetical protein